MLLLCIRLEWQLQNSSLHFLLTNLLFVPLLIPLQAQRKLNRATSGKIVKKIKKAKRKLKNDKKVFQIIVVFPLPSKDPLLSHRKLYEYSSIYSLREGEGQLGVDLER